MAAEPRLILACWRRKTENPFTAVTEKMSQSLSVAFTAKCAERGVCVSRVQPVICQVFFIFFIKSRLLYTLAASEDERRETSGGVKRPFRPTFR